MRYSLHLGDNVSEPLTRLKVSDSIEALKEFANASETCQRFGYVISEYCYSDLYKRWMTEKTIIEKKGRTK